MRFSDIPTSKVVEDDGLDPKAQAALVKSQTAAAAKAQQAAAAKDALTKQILGSSDPTKWTGEGFGSAQANAADMANVLSKAGITDISQLGQRTIKGQTYSTENGDYTEPDKTQYYNKATGQVIDPGYDRAGGNIFSGTFAGAGSTGYGVQFDAQGNPHFYTQYGGSTSDLGSVAPILSMLSVIPSPLQPFAAAANAAVAASQGNVLGALASVSGVPGVSEALSSVPALSDVMNVAKTANQVSNTAKAIESGNVLGALSGVSGLTGSGGTTIGDTGVTVNDALKTANLASAIASGDPSAMSRAVSMISSQPTQTETPLTPDEELQRSLNRLQKSLGDTGYTPPEADTHINQPVTPEAPPEGALPSVSPQVPTEEPIAQPFVGALPSSDTVNATTTTETVPVESPAQLPVEEPKINIGALPSSDTVNVTAPTEAPAQLPVEQAPLPPTGALPSSDTVNVTAPLESPPQTPVEPPPLIEDPRDLPPPPIGNPQDFPVEQAPLPPTGALPSSDTVNVTAPLETPPVEAPAQLPEEQPTPSVGALPSSDTVEVKAPLETPTQLPVEEPVLPSIQTPPDKTPEVVITSDRPKQEQPTETSPLSIVPSEDKTPEVVITSDRPVQPQTPIEVGTVNPSDIPITTPPVASTPTVKAPTSSTPSTSTTTASSGSSGATSNLLPKFLEVKDPWLTIKGPTNKGGVQQEQLRQLYQSLDPELQAQMSSKMQDTQEAAHGGSIYSSIDPDLLQLLSARMGYADGGDVNPFAIMQKTMDDTSPKFVKQAPAFLQPRGQTKGAQLQPLTQMKATPHMGGLAHGGLPSKYAEAAPENHHPEFITGITGYYAGGRGTGQSDDIPAMLHDGDYVIDAEAVSAFGDGSSKAGKGVLSHFMHQVPHKDGAEGNPVPAKIADGEFVLPASFVTALGGGDNKHGAALLDEMREKLRAHKRSAPTSKIPPKAKSPLDYLKGVKG